MSEKVSTSFKNCLKGRCSVYVGKAFSIGFSFGSSMTFLTFCVSDWIGINENSSITKIEN
jgi:hypothetical protein